MAVLGYTVSLRAQERRGEALAALENLPLAERRRTHVALWEGVLLVEMERLAEARLALAGVDPAQLLPEEEKLRREATQRAAPASQKRIPPAPKKS